MVWIMGKNSAATSASVTIATGITISATAPHITNALSPLPLSSIVNTLEVAAEVVPALDDNGDGAAAGELEAGVGAVGAGGGGGGRERAALLPLSALSALPALLCQSKYFGI